MENDPIIAKMLANRTVIDVDEAAESERRRRMYRMLLSSRKYKRLQVEDANTKWFNEGELKNEFDSSGQKQNMPSPSNNLFQDFESNDEDELNQFSSFQKQSESAYATSPCGALLSDFSDLTLATGFTPRESLREIPDYNLVQVCYDTSGSRGGPTNISRHDERDQSKKGNDSSTRSSHETSTEKSELESKSRFSRSIHGQSFAKVSFLSTVEIIPSA
ncbi:UNVERIFIED_CONTAM: hypothetical protein HDU68_009054 [Siphonaria sp. JEL0065]|nr:hypothetical protein HDU68_009054 [Siphonaria sp. JEL0065]